MASLGTVSWGSSPAIDIVFTYDYYRSGANMVYNVHVSVQPVTGARYFGYPIYVEVKMDGSAHGSGTIKSASPSQWSSSITWSTGNQTISNKTSGSTSLSIRVYSGSGSTRNTTYSYSMAVSPAGSTLTASNGTLGTAQTITINKQNASFTDTVTYTCGAQSGTIVTDTLAGSVSWTPPISLASEVTDSTSVPVTLTTTTKSSGTTIQSNSLTITCAIPASVKPSCMVAISDPTGYATTYGAYVQTKSTLQSVITATTSYGSPINTYSTVADGNTYTTQTTTTPVLQNTGAQTVTATVTDKRGRTSDAATASYSVLAYAQPTLSSCVIQRCDNLGNADPEGHYMSIDFTGVITALNNINSAVWSIRYRVAGSGTWTDVALPSLTGNYTPTHQEVIAAADANAFEVEVRASDDFGTTTVGSGSIPIAFTIMNWRTNGDGMAIGGINTQAGLQIYMDTEVTGDADFQGDVNVVDVDASGDYKQNGSSIFPISPANGGTGQTSISAFLNAISTEYTDSGTVTGQTHRIKTWTVNGSGIVFIQAQTKCDNTSSYGTTYIEIYKGSTLVATQNIRTDTSSGAQVCASAAVMLKVTNGDTIKTDGTSSKGGTKTITSRVIAFGCTLA